jgi:Holliday junction DNA helicase RuvA
MIAFVEGILAALEVGERSALIVSVGGVGYRIRVPQRVLKQVPAIGETVQVFTHLAVRETEMVLYGFLSPAERDLFGELIKVSGVGPSLGLALLNTLSLPDLVQAVVSNNTRVLALTPGVGSKTAQRLALELKTKLADWRHQAGLTPSLTQTVSAGLREEVEMALLALGYRPAEIAEAITTLSRRQLKESTEIWIREAIAFLSA